MYNIIVVSMWFATQTPSNLSMTTARLTVLGVRSQYTDCSDSIKSTSHEQMFLSVSTRKDCGKASDMAELVFNFTG